MMKLIVHGATDKVMGAMMCGPDAPEIIQVRFYPRTIFCGPALLRWQDDFFPSGSHFNILNKSLLALDQGLAVALKCGATKAQFDATVSLRDTLVFIHLCLWFHEKPCALQAFLYK